MTGQLSLIADDVEDDLRASVRGVLARHCTTERLNACYAGDHSVAGPAWTALGSDLGLAGLLVPEALGGAGASAREAAVVLEEIGRATAPVPFLTSSVVAATVLLEVGDTDLLPRLATGALTAALLVPGTAAGSEAPVLLDGGADGLGGTVRNVVGVAGGVPADVLLVPVAGVDGPELHVVEADAAGVEISPVVSLDMTRPVADVTLAGAPSVRLPGDAGRALDTALRAGAGLLASEQVGVADWCLEATVGHLRERRQFGRVVGGFQSLKHRLADLYAGVESARAAARYAAATLAAGDPDAEVAVAVAQAYCSGLAVSAAEEAVQLHGGLGMTWEHPVHLRLKRAKSDQLLLGSAETHRSALARLVDLPAGG